MLNNRQLIKCFYKREELLDFLNYMCLDIEVPAKSDYFEEAKSAYYVVMGQGEIEHVSIQCVSSGSKWSQIELYDIEDELYPDEMFA